MVAAASAFGTTGGVGRKIPDLRYVTCRRLTGMRVKDQSFLTVTSQVKHVDLGMPIWSASTVVSLNLSAIAENAGMGYTSQWSDFVDLDEQNTLAEAVCYMVDDYPLRDLDELFYVLDAFSQDTSVVAGRLRQALRGRPSSKLRDVERLVVFDSVTVAEAARGHGLAALSAAHCLYHAGCWSSTALAASIPGARVPVEERDYVTKRAEHLLDVLGFEVLTNPFGPLYLSDDTKSLGVIRDIVAEF